jgi:hypothetical protein
MFFTASDAAGERVIAGVKVSEEMIFVSISCSIFAP